MIEKHFNTIGQVSFCISLVYRLLRFWVQTCEFSLWAVQTTTGLHTWKPWSFVSLLTAAPSWCTSISKYYRCGFFFPAIKWGLVFGARLKKRKTKYETWCTVCTNSAWFRCENERRAAHMSEEDDMRSSVEESSDLAPPPAVWRIAWYFCMWKTYALLMCWVAFALLQRWETVPCAGLLTLCSPYGHPSEVREKTPPPLTHKHKQN